MRIVALACALLLAGAPAAYALPEVGLPQKPEILPLDDALLPDHFVLNDKETLFVIMFTLCKEQYEAKYPELEQATDIPFQVGEDPEDDWNLSGEEALELAAGVCALRARDAMVKETPAP